MRKSEQVREFIITLRNMHCNARNSALAEGNVNSLAAHAMAAEALLAVDAFLAMEFGLDDLEFQD